VSPEIREKIEMILKGERMSLTTLDLDGVVLLHRFTCQRCEFSEDFTDDQVLQLEQSHMWRQFGFAPIGSTFRPGVLCSDCVKTLMKWWGDFEIKSLDVHDHVGDEDVENDTTVPIDREAILQ
jgi:hypothetical protein